MWKLIDSIVTWLGSYKYLEVGEFAFDTPLDDTIRGVMHAWERKVRLTQGDWETLYRSLYSTSCQDNGANAG